MPASPPPEYNFARVPVVTSRDPLWTERGSFPAVGGLEVDKREYIVSTAREAEPKVRESAPEPSFWPFIAALAVTALFIGSIFTPWAVVWGSIPVTIALIGWFWPKTKEDES